MNTKDLEVIIILYFHGINRPYFWPTALHASLDQLALSQSSIINAYYTVLLLVVPTIAAAAAAAAAARPPPV